MENKIKVIIKAFNIIEILNQSEKLTLKDITQKVKLPKPTIYRILNTLQSIGYIQYDPLTQSHSLSHKFLMLAKNYSSQNDLINVAIPFITKLKQTFGETVNLAKLAGGHAVFLAIEESRHRIRIVDKIGDIASLHSTAVGKAIAAFLPEERLNEIFKDYNFHSYTKKTITDYKSLKESLIKVREAGYAIDSEEGHEGVMCIGAPIFNTSNLPFAAISISMPKIRTNKTIIKEISQQLPKVGIQISLGLGVTDIRKCLIIN